MTNKDLRGLSYGVDVVDDIKFLSTISEPKSDSVEMVVADIESTQVNLFVDGSINIVQYTNDPDSDDSYIVISPYKLIELRDFINKAINYNEGKDNDV